MLPRIVVEKLLAIERGRFHGWSADIEARGHVGSCPGFALLTSQGKVTKPRKVEFRDRLGTIIERNSTGKSKDEFTQRQNR